MKNGIYLLIVMMSFSSFSQERIISVVPAVTEMIFELGVRERLIAVSDYCRYPDEAKKMKKVGSPFTPNIEGIIALKPDLVLTQKLHDKSFIKKLGRLNIAYKEFKITTYEDVLTTLRKLGKLLKRSPTALIQELRKREKELKALKLKGDFLIIINSEMMSMSAAHFMGAGSETYLDEIVRKTGLKNWFGKVKGYKEVGREKLFVDPPRYIFIFNKKIRAGLDGKKSKIILLNPKWALVPGPRVRSMMEELVSKLH